MYIFYLYDYKIILEPLKEIRSQFFNKIFLLGFFTNFIDFKKLDIKEFVWKASFCKYYLSNKVYIHIDLGQLSIENIYVDYSASLNSFFTIQYSVVIIKNN